MKKNKKTDLMFMQIAALVAQQSKCISYKVGCLIVKDGRIVTMGYNGTPSGFINCSEEFGNLDMSVPENREKHHAFSEKYEIHAEQNSILFAAKNGVSIDGATVYTTVQPCYTCLKMFCQSGIRRIVYGIPYDKAIYDKEIMKLIKQSDITIEHLEN